MRLLAVAFALLLVGACDGGPPDGGDDSSSPAGEGPPVVGSHDGIGAFDFGADADEVLAGLTLRWGPPDTDDGFGTPLRTVAWGRFRVCFSRSALTGWSSPDGAGGEPCRARPLP